MRRALRARSHPLTCSLAFQGHLRRKQQLKQATASAMTELVSHERYGAQKRKAALGHRGHTKVLRKTKEMGVFVSQRVKECSEQKFKLSTGVLFCQAFKEELSNLKEEPKRHVALSKRQTKFEMFMSLAVADYDLSTDLADYYF